MASERIEKLKRKLSRKYNPLDESGSPPPIAVTRLMTPEQAAAAPKGPAVAEPAPKSVEYRCGHRELIARFKSGDCPECRAKRRREKAAKEREKRDAKKADASGQFRFPVNSSVVAAWNGATWEASLSVPGENGTVRQFRAASTGVEKALRELKRLYVESLTAAPEGTPA
jgi:hypothetical protein